MEIKTWVWVHSSAQAWLSTQIRHPFAETLEELEVSLTQCHFLEVAPAFYPALAVEGWIDQATIDAIVADIDAWAKRPEAFHAELYCHAIGWVSE